MTRSKLRVARQTFAVQVDGEEILIREGERLAADHPLIEGRAELFRDEAQPDLKAPEPPKPSRRRKG